MARKRDKRFIDSALDNIGAIIVLTIIILVIFQIIARYVFKSPSPWSEELARYSLIWLVMLGAVMSFKDKECLKIEFFVDLLSSKYQKLFHLFSDLIIFFVSSVVLYYGWSFVILNHSQHSPSIVWLPLSWICLAMPVGSGLILIYVIEDFLKELNLFKIKIEGIKNVDS